MPRRPNRHTMIISVACLSLFTLAGCDMRAQSGYGFTLPEGNITKGEQAFGRFACNDCHVINDREDLRLEESIPALMEIPLGGDTTRIETYGELVTSIINPSHEISQKYSGQPVEYAGKSMMRNYNDAMTVSELIDIVAFVQDQYELRPYPLTSYANFE